MRRTGLVAPRHVGSSQTRARTRGPCIGRRILNHGATREALKQYALDGGRGALISTWHPASSSPYRPGTVHELAAGLQTRLSNPASEGLVPACSSRTPIPQEEESERPAWSPAPLLDHTLDPGVLEFPAQTDSEPDSHV